MKNKKAVFMELQGIIIPLLSIIILLVVASLIISETKTQIVKTDASYCRSGFTYNNSNEICFNTTGAGADTYTPGRSMSYNITTKGFSVLDTISSFVPILAIVAVAVILIGLVFLFKQKGET